MLSRRHHRQRKCLQNAVRNFEGFIPGGEINKCEVLVYRQNADGYPSQDGFSLVNLWTLNRSIGVPEVLMVADATYLGVSFAGNGEPEVVAEAGELKGAGDRIQAAFYNLFHVSPFSLNE